MRRKKKAIKTKPVRFEVDQSVRIEEMGRATYVAIANSTESFVVALPASTKRQLKEYFRRQGQPKLFAPKLFAALIIIAIKQSGFIIRDLVIDTEYPGYVHTISQYLKKHFPKLEIDFFQVGRKSSAHYAAYGAYIKKRKANKIITTTDVLRLTKK